MPPYAFRVDAITRRTNSFLAALAGVLRDAREACGLSKVELAARAGLSQPYIGYIEQGARCPTADTLMRLSMALDIPLSQLIGRAEEASGK